MAIRMITALAPKDLNIGLTPPLALYVHWPFCVSKCPYCDFNSHVRASVDQDAWAAALLADLAHEAALLPGRKLGSIFFGGGTPSLMPPATVAAIIDAAVRHWSPERDIEITLEANPSSVEAARFADLAVAGVNRVSLGLQALDDHALRFLGRAHDVHEGLGALETAQAAFARVSFDLIYARPDQSDAAWATELDRALSFGTEHMSLYQLTIEPGTRFATLVQQGELTPLDDERAATLFETTRATMAARGLPAYEISNHARRGAESRHNLTYWRYNDYAGIGPGAHGRRLGRATVRHKKPENWMAQVHKTGYGIQSDQLLRAADQSTEALLMGLRLAEGVDLAAICARLGNPSPVNENALAHLEAIGLLTRSGTRIKISERGTLLLDSILAEIVA
jgi:putative oxygen-independent coproporphyrinogen III oxidase